MVVGTELVTVCPYEQQETESVVLSAFLLDRTW
jgi:hypothetical protein